MSFSQYSLWLRRSGLVIILFSRCLFDILSFFVRLVDLISEFCSGSDVSSIFFKLVLFTSCCCSRSDTSIEESQLKETWLLFKPDEDREEVLSNDMSFVSLSNEHSTVSSISQEPTLPWQLFLSKILFRQFFFADFLSLTTSGGVAMVIAHLSFIALDISIGDDLDNSRSHGLEFDSISNDCDLFVLLSAGFVSWLAIWSKSWVIWRWRVKGALGSSESPCKTKIIQYISYYFRYDISLSLRNS